MYYSVNYSVNFLYILVVNNTGMKIDRRKGMIDEQIFKIFFSDMYVWLVLAEYFVRKFFQFEIEKKITSAFVSVI